jgi:molybdopterin molybdotransferase
MNAAAPTMARRHHGHTAMDWGEARTLAHQLPTPLGVQDIALAAAAGRTLAQTLTAAATLPGFDNAAMDGYAVRSRGPWRLVGRTLASAPRACDLRCGEALEIATGAPVPANTDRVVPYEAAHRSDGWPAGERQQAHRETVRAPRP